MLNVLASKEEIKECQERMEATFKRKCSVVEDVTFGHKGESYTEDVYYSEGAKLWAYIDVLENRYWNLFGQGKPKLGENNNITVEINPPIEGINRKCQGAFAKNEEGEVFLLHRGGIGGGRKGIGKNLVKKHFNTWERAVDGTGERDFILVGKIDSDKFFDRLSKFVEVVGCIKELGTLDSEA